MKESEKQFASSGEERETKKSEKFAVVDLFVDELEKNGYSGLEDAKLKKLMKRFPDRLEEISVLNDFGQYIQEQDLFTFFKEFKKEPGNLEALKKMVEYQSLLIHFIYSNKDQEYLERVWDYFKNAAEYIGNEGQGPEDEEKIKNVFLAMRVGILGQVALEHLFMNAGVPFETATPTEDIYKKIDLWTRSETHPVALQIKTSKRFDNLEVIEEPNSVPPHMMRTNKKNKYFYTKLFKDINSFLMRTKKYEKEVGKPIVPYAVLMPWHEINEVTGEPSKDLKKQFRKKIRNVLA